MNNVFNASVFCRTSNFITMIYLLAGKLKFDLPI